MQESTPNKSKSGFWRRVAAALLAVPVAIMFAAPGASAIEPEAPASEESEQLPGLPVPGLPGDAPSQDDLVSLLGECVAALIETVVGAVPADAVPAPAEADEQLPATDTLKPCLDLLTQLGLPISLPDLPVPDLPLPLEEPAVE